MKTLLTVAAILAATATLGTAPTLSADEAKPALSCSDITYHADFLKAYPRAAAACQEVVDTDGKRSARFTAHVDSVKKDQIQLTFLNAMGKPIEPEQKITLLPQAGQTLRLDGKDVDFSKLSKGDKVDFWVPENRLGVITNPNDTAISTIVLP